MRWISIGAGTILRTESFMAGERMISGHEADKAFFEQELNANARWWRHSIEHEIYCTTLEIAKDCVVPRLEAQRRVRRLLEDALEQCRAEEQGSIVATHQPELLFRAGRIEDLRGEQNVQRGHDRDELAPDAFGPRCELIPTRVTHEQFVAEGGPKSLQGTAHRGLAETNSLGRS